MKCGMGDPADNWEFNLPSELLISEPQLGFKVLDTKS